jgi:hypothetical protein
VKDIFDVLNQVRTRTAELNDALSLKHKLSSGDAPIGAFNMVNQFAVVATELLTHYAAAWESIPASAVDADRRQEWAERLTTITKSAFILGMSAIEFSAKQAVLGHPGKVAPPKGRAYLRAIIRNSKTVGLVTSVDEDGWSGLIEIRNILVHNNGIADTNATHAFPGGPTIQLTAGAMTKANLRFFPELTLWAVEAFGRWSDEFLMLAV